MNTPDEPQASPELVAVARRHDAAIRAAVEDRYGVPASDCQVMHSDTFASDARPGAVCFMVVSPDAIFGVMGTETDGTWIFEATPL